MTPFRFNSQLTAAQPGSGRGQVGVAAGELSCELLFISNRSFKFLLSCCVSLIEVLLPLSLRAGTYQLSFNSVLAGLRCRNLGFSLVDSSKRLIDASVLQLALAKVVLDGSPGGLYGRIRLGNLRLIIVVLQFNDEVPFVYLLIVGDGYTSNDSGHLRTERREIAANISIVSNLFDMATFPGIPVPGNGNQDSQSEEYDQNGRKVFLPT